MHTSKSPVIVRQNLIIKGDQSYTKIKFDQKQKSIKNQKRSNTSKSQFQSQRRGVSRSPSRHSNILHKTNISLKQQMDNIITSMKGNRSKIQKALNFLKAIDSFSQQQRCIQHNNVITLYCLNDRKLMCIYCIYGINKHRHHKILPVNENLQYVTQDVERLKDDFKKQLLNLDSILDNAKLNTQLLQNLLKQTLAHIQKQYYKKKQDLQSLYEKQKKLVTKRYQDLIAKSQQLSSNYGQIKFGIWQYQAKYNLERARISDIKQTLSQHIILEHIMATISNIQHITLNEKDVEKRVISKNQLSLYAPNPIKSQDQDKKMIFTLNNKK